MDIAAVDDRQAAYPFRLGPPRRSFPNALRYIERSTSYSGLSLRLLFLTTFSNPAFSAREAVEQPSYSRTWKIVERCSAGVVCMIDHFGDHSLKNS